MERAIATLRVRSADQFADTVGLLDLRPSRLQSRFEVTAGGLTFDLPGDEQVRVHLTSSAAPFRMLPRPEILLPTRDVTGVRFDSGRIDGSFVVHFVGEGGNISAREVEPNRRRWFDPPEGTTGLALSVVVRGQGELHLENVSITVPSVRGRLPAGPRLLEGLVDARFPSGPTAWPMRFEVSWIGLDRVAINGYELSLRAPDWNAVDILDRTRQLLIHGMAIAPNLIDRGPQGAMTMARILLDWSRHHPSRPHSTTVMAWNDMAVAKRTMAILSVLDALRFERPAEADRLADMAANHATWLAHARNYMEDHDHGLYADTALQIAARALSSHSLTDRWRTLAAQRFESTAAAIIDATEGTVREHSPAYVEAVADLVAERESNGLRHNMGTIRDRFERTLSSLTTPAGTLIPWGDTSLDHSSDRVRPRGAIRFPNTGWSVSHHDDTLVAITSSFHSRAHKHRDELSLVVYDQRGPVIFEAGLPGYGYGTEDRSYAESAHAHSGVVFDPPLVPDEPVPFGGAIAEPAVHGAWHVMMGWNPLLRGATHHRLPFHHPDVIVIVDLATGQEVGSVTRLFHVAPDLEVESLDATSVKLGERRLTFAAPAESIVLATDDKSRHFPAAGSVNEHTTIRATTRGPGAYAAVLARTPVRVSQICTSASETEMLVSLDLDDGTRLTVTGSPGATPRRLRLETSQPPEARALH